MRHFILTVSAFLFCFSLSGQNSKNLKKIESLYNEAKIEAQAGNREKAIQLLTQTLRLDPSYYPSHFALADIYHESGKPDLEIQELKTGLKFSESNYPQGFKFLAQALYEKGDYTEAFDNINHYSVIKKTLDAGEKRLLDACIFARQAIENPVPFHPENIGGGINTSEDEYWPCLDAEGKELIFTRLLKSSPDGQKLMYPQEDLFRSMKDSDKWMKAVALDASVNTPGNEGAQCISADGRLLFFTACGRSDGKGSCDIYMSVRKNGKWSEAVNLGEPVNTSAWETQPSISSDGHYLFFTSNRKGGKGKMDIWRAEKVGITPSGFPVYGKVINMESLNTPGDELSPFIHADGRTLYFASDYWPGMGGRDLFEVKIGNNNTSVPQNLGYPINTSANEEGLIVETSGQNAFFTSNAKGFGGRDIFSFQLPEKVRPEPVSYVKGKVIDKKTGKTLLPTVQLMDLTTDQEIQRIYPFENEGEFLLCLPAGRNYGLSVSKEGYLFCSKNFNSEHSLTQSKPLSFTIEMDPIEVGATTVLNNIFFATDSFTLKSESKTQLEEMFLFLKNNPRLVVEIGGHTDNKGSEEYNRNLSDKRAAAVTNYLINKGIPSTQLKSKGYGFSKPIADNSTEEGRAVNRRTEFKIISQ